MARARARDAPRPVGEEKDEFTAELRLVRLEAAVGALAGALFGVHGSDHLPTAPIGRRAARELIDELAMIEGAS